MIFRAGKAFENASTWEASVAYIRENGGFVPRIVEKAIKARGLNLLDGYP